MSDDADQTEATEPAPEVTPPQHEEFPEDHPLVKALAAQKNTIKELKSKAARLDELEEAQKSDAEKFADKVAKLESEAASVPARVAAGLREHLIKLHGIDGEDAELFLTATDPELLLKQVDRLVAQSAPHNNGLHVPAEGRNPSAPALNSDDLENALRRSLGM